MIITRDLRERFVKENKLPIRVFDSDFFMGHLTLAEPFFHSLTLYTDFLDMVNTFENEDAYFEYYKQVKEDAIQFIQSTEAFRKFNEIDLEKEWPVVNTGYPSKDIFHADNLHKRFVSIDMRKANFNTMKHFDPGFFGGADTWEDFLGKFTNFKHIKNSKYIRQVILGACNPKRQTQYEKHLMDQILTRLLESGVNTGDVKFFSNDEIVLEITDHEEYRELINRVVASAEVPIRTDYFVLEGVRKNQDKNPMGYIRRMEDGSIDFKGVTTMYMPFVLRALQHEDVAPYDMVFETESGELAKLMKVPVITFEA